MKMSITQQQQQQKEENNETTFQKNSLCDFYKCIYKTRN